MASYARGCACGGRAERRSQQVSGAERAPQSPVADAVSVIGADPTRRSADPNSRRRGRPPLARRAAPRSVGRRPMSAVWRSGATTAGWWRAAARRFNFGELMSVTGDLVLVTCCW